ncbi:MAG: NADP oxidoreductase [Gemmatimonadetes bacterium]|nr:NADP oxidoreductase [Gemmatimonadota bacterium]
MTAILRVAIVGAGPSGFFLAEKLLGQTDRPVAVDLYERLPVPYGLVRFGVAPDHEKIKAVTRSFDKVAGRPGFRFFGNVEIGRHLSVTQLREAYDAVAFTTGAQSDRRMGIPGEDLVNSHAATEFVAWYNGHPDFRDRHFNLDAESVAVVGVGNVAVDVARILSRSPDELAKTDIADHALEALCHSKVKNIYLLGRRGPAQAAFTTPEVKELGEMALADAVTLPREVALDPLSAAQVAADEDASVTRKIEVLTQFAERPPAGKPKCLTLRFLVSPTELINDGHGNVSAIRLAHNRLVEKHGAIAAEPTGESETIPVGLVFRSVGYRGTAIPGLPFDEKTGTVPNQGGRVSEGLYVAGWIKRGPSGVIGTNKPDAAATAEAILADCPFPKPPSAELLVPSAEIIDWAAWQRINTAETAQGKAGNRPRVKLTTIEAMLNAAR